MIVVAITATMMVIEIGAGLAFGSMALLADGLHMASHAAALGISVLAYLFARRHAHDARFSFGTGKINSLAGFASAVMLAVVAVLMAGQSVERLLHPVTIDFGPALTVAIVGLAINAVCLLILKGDHAHDHTDDEDHDHHEHEAHDHNLWSAYIHVLADALTSVLAIGALMAGKRFGAVWLDPLMGILGAILISRWAWSLISVSGHVLLDMQAPEALRRMVRRHIEQDADNRVADLHVWAIGPGLYSAAISVITDKPQPADHYRGLLPSHLGIVHTTVEVHHCREHATVRA